MEVEVHLHKRERESEEHFPPEKRTKGGRIVIGPLTEVLKEELLVTGVTPEEDVKAAPAMRAQGKSRG